MNTASTFFSRTTDGGLIWTSPAIIPITPQRGVYTNAAAMRVLPDGTLVNVFVQVGSDPTASPGAFMPPTSVWVVRSPDQGTTWPDAMHPIRVTDDIPAIVVPSVAVGADGTLYAVWHLMDESTSSSQIQFVKSVDGGLTWSAKAPVAVETTQAFLPTVAVSPAGTVGVTYFDHRNDVPGDQELTTDLWFRHSHDGGATWSETHLAGPFDLRPAPSPGGGGGPLGDYFGLAPTGRTGFGAAWVQTITPRDQGATDTFFARLRVSPRR